MARSAVKPAAKSAFDKRVDTAFHEVWHDVPTSVIKSGKTGKARRAMMTAIAMSKAKAATRRG